MRYLWAVVTGRLNHFNKYFIQDVKELQLLKSVSSGSSKTDRGDVSHQVIRLLIEGNIILGNTLFSPTQKNKKVLNVDVKKITPSQFYSINRVLLGSFSALYSLKKPYLKDEISSILKEAIQFEENGVKIFDDIQGNNSLDVGYVGGEVWKYLMSIIGTPKNFEGAELFEFYIEYGTTANAVFEVTDEKLKKRFPNLF